jgi:hypothetical protein
MTIREKEIRKEESEDYMRGIPARRRGVRKDGNEKWENVV